ncbi:DMT family transporter [Proteiniborus sp. MB09-C3]|uniref:DMT family transporter n=1 Tax=Proteiniborus sp. MB09-C3 TaxID=3050072 RepID=UPI002555A841|nr:DMT family transporter [Proteiniborus sp. MB09-C3]WIV13083.1 DMT family transporter [Proteiniborus sp. MB09-C3]
MSKQLKADIALLLVTIGWGASFLLIKSSLSELSTFNFLALRFSIAFILSLIVFFKKIIKADKKTLKHGIVLGIVVYATYGLQTIGLNYTTASKSAFITGFNVILVPIFSTLLMKKLPDKKVFFSVFIAFIGLGLLTLNKNVSGINIGDIYTFICAITCAVHILLIGKYTKECDSVALAIIQIGVCAILSLITSLTFESPIIPSNYDVWINIIILSVVCTLGVFIVQSVAQKYTSPTHAALIFTGEPVFAAVFGYIILGEVLSSQGFIGAILILIGMVITEIDFKVAFKEVA